MLRVVKHVEYDTVFYGIRNVEEVDGKIRITPVDEVPAAKTRQELQALVHAMNKALEAPDIEE